jgi:N-acetylglucosamine kinase-like BadF-type ATPase
MEEEINKISNKNLRQLLNLLDGLNASEAIKESVKSFFWKNSDEIVNKIKER